MIAPGAYAHGPDRAYFASWTGTAPIEASSGDQVRHRLSRGGNRQINRALHIMATVQLRTPTQGRAYFGRKKQTANLNGSHALLEARLSDQVVTVRSGDHWLRLWISRPEAGRPLCPEYAVWRSGYPT